MGHGELEGGAPAEAGVVPQVKVDGDAPRIDLETTYARALRADLERRLTEIARYDEDVFGRTGLVDAVVTIGLCVLLPIAAVLAAWSWR